MNGIGIKKHEIDQDNTFIYKIKNGKNIRQLKQYFKSFGWIYDESLSFYSEF